MLCRAMTVVLTAVMLGGSVVTAAAQAPVTALPGASASDGIHRVLSADVSHVDQRSGLLLLKTDAGRLTFEAPPAVTDALVKGDRVIVEIVLRHPDAAPARDDRPARPLFARRLPGDITAVNRLVGVVVIGTSAGRFNIDVPRSAVAKLRTGDRIALDVAIFSEDDVAASAVVQPRARGAGAALFFMLFGRPR
jgi:hypothetical protein